CALILPSAGDLRDLYAFPTRRSSDLVCGTSGCTRDQGSPPACSPSRSAAATTRACRTYSGSRGSSRSSPISADSAVGNCWNTARSEEHTSELQSRENLVCRLLLEKKK